MSAETLSAMLASAQAAFAACAEAASLENCKAQYLGKNGLVTEHLKALASLSGDEKRQRGQEINTVKTAIEDALNEARQTLKNKEIAQRLAAESIDISLPARGRSDNARQSGAIHPVMQTSQRVEDLFRSIGFAVADGPEVENDWFNFTALNNPENHPARSMQDTFYLDCQDEQGKPLLLRTHTSPMQVRYAMTQARLGAFPIKVIVPGRTYRVDSDATHSPMFHQVEGLWLDKNVSFADLKGVYTHFLRHFFATDALKVRFRPSYFPFTEPSAEIDVAFSSGPLKDRWLEISGCGQVHPSVIQNMGLDAKELMGFAFGSGLERLTMLRWGISDLRAFFSGDVRFLHQFSGLLS